MDIKTPFTIGDICYTSYPCQHYVTIEGKSTMMSATAICQLYNHNNIAIPDHFKYIENDNNLEAIRETIASSDDIVIMKGFQDNLDAILQTIIKNPDFANGNKILNLINLRETTTIDHIKQAIRSHNQPMLEKLLEFIPIHKRHSLPISSARSGNLTAMTYLLEDKDIPYPQTSLIPHIDLKHPNAKSLIDYLITSHFSNSKISNGEDALYIRKYYPDIYHQLVEYDIIGNHVCYIRSVIKMTGDEAIDQSLMPLSQYEKKYISLFEPMCNSDLMVMPNQVVQLHDLKFSIKEFKITLKPSALLTIESAYITISRREIKLNVINNSVIQFISHDSINFGKMGYNNVIELLINYTCTEPCFIESLVFEIKGDAYDNQSFDYENGLIKEIKINDDYKVYHNYGTMELKKTITQSIYNPLIF